MADYKRAKEVATKYQKLLDTELKNHSCRSAGDLVDTGIEYFELKELSDSYLTLLNQHDRMKELITMCKGISGIEDFS